MTPHIKILILMIMFLSLASFAGGHSAWAMDDNESQINLYSSQKININKRPLAPAPKVAIEPAPSKTFVVTEEYYNPPQVKEIKDPVPSLNLQPTPAPIVEKDNQKKIETQNKAEVHDAAKEVHEDVQIEWETPSPEAKNNKDYILGADDKIKLSVYGEKDLSGEFRVTSDNTISLPLIGVIDVAHKSLRQTEIFITEKLKDGYLNDPIVSIEVIESRPFYIMGEVRNPGSYAYVNGINILQAVALSGGFTIRANRKSIDVLRGGISEAEAEPMEPNAPVQPGDTIYIRERFF